MAINSKGNIIVCEGAECRVSIIDPNLEDPEKDPKIKSFGSKGHDDGQFLYPTGVAVDQDDDSIFVVDGNKRIQKFTSDGMFDSATPKNSLLGGPMAIAINPDSKMIYVTDINNHCIHILNPDLTMSDYCSIGSQWDGNKQLSSP